MQEIKSLLTNTDFSYKWKGFALSFFVVFVFVFLQNIGFDLNWPKSLAEKTQASSVVGQEIEKLKRDIPILKTGASETDGSLSSSESN